MNSQQKNNQSIIANALLNGQVLESCNLTREKIILKSSNWETYWECIEKNDEFITNAYLDFKYQYRVFYESKFNKCFYNCYCQSYQNLLSEILAEIYKDNWKFFEPLQKLLMFGNFAITNDVQDNSVACVFNLANPNYLFSRICRPKGLQDSKFLPIILQPRTVDGYVELFCHYRQVPLRINKEARLFFYFPSDLQTRYKSFSIINNFINSIYYKRDPFVKERAKYISEKIIEKLLKRVSFFNKKTIRILDIGGGYGLLIIKILENIFQRCPELIADKSIEWTIIECPGMDYSFLYSQKIFCSKILKFHYIKSDFQKWVIENEECVQKNFDLVFACRILNNISTISIESMDRDEFEGVIENHNTSHVSDKLQKSIILRSTNSRKRYKQGYIYKQLLNELYYKGLSIVYNHTLPSAEQFFYPFRKINLESLTVNLEKSLIGVLCKIGRYVIIEDIDLDYRDLIEHLQRYGIHNLVIRDFTSVLKLKTSHLFCISEDY